MGCNTSKTEKTKELKPQDKNHHIYGNDNKQSSQKEIRQDLEIQPDSKFKEDKINNMNYVQPTESHSNQNNEVQNNQYPNSHGGMQQNNQHQQQQSSQKEIIKVNEQKQESPKKNEKIEQINNLENKNSNQKKNKQPEPKKPSLGKNQLDGDDYNTKDFEEGVHVNKVNEGDCTRTLRIGQNSNTNFGQPLQKTINSSAQQQQQSVINNNNNNNMLGNQNQEQTQQTKPSQSNQYRPLEIKKLDQEQEQKAMEQYEKLMQNQQYKTIEQSYQTFDESTLQQMIQKEIKSLNWRQALYFNTSLLKLNLEKQQANASQATNKILLSQIDLLLKNGQYESAFFYASNYLDDTSEYAQYICGNYYYMNSKYQEGFQRINDCLQLCIKNNLEIKPEYIICAGNCLIEIQEAKHVISYFDQLPLKNCQALNTPENLNAIAEQYIRLNKLDQAKDILKMLLNKYADNYDGLINYGLVYVQDDMKKAKQYFKQALDIVQNQKNDTKKDVNMQFLQNMINS